MPSVTTFLLCAVALLSAGKASAATPKLVNLPKLTLGAQAPAAAKAQTADASSQVAVLRAVDEPEHRSKHGSARRG